MYRQVPLPFLVPITYLANSCLLNPGLKRATRNADPDLHLLAQKLNLMCVIIWCRCYECDGRGRRTGGCQEVPLTCHQVLLPPRQETHHSLSTPGPIPSTVLRSRPSLWQFRLRHRQIAENWVQGYKQKTRCRVTNIKLRAGLQTEN